MRTNSTGGGMMLRLLLQRSAVAVVAIEAGDENSSTTRDISSCISGRETPIGASDSETAYLPR